MPSTVTNLLSCPLCHSEISKKGGSIFCINCKKVFPLLGGKIADLLVHRQPETEFSLEKWESIYSQNDTDLMGTEEEYKNLFMKPILKQIWKCHPSLSKRKIFLEVGCGQGFLGEEMDKNGWFLIGIDFSLTGLKKLKSRLDQRKIKNYLLIRGNVENLPLKDNSIDFAYGAGVIGHLKNTQGTITEIYRVLKKKGISFNAVPYFNLGNLFYRSAWGSIPNFPVLKPLMEFIHLRLLRGRHLVFGYELQFTKSQLIKYHQNAGFSRKNISVGRFDCYIQLYQVKNEILKKWIRKLCQTSSWFWPMAKVIARKD